MEFCRLYAVVCTSYSIHADCVVLNKIAQLCKISNNKVNLKLQREKNVLKTKNNFEENNKTQLKVQIANICLYPSQRVLTCTVYGKKSN